MDVVLLRPLQLCVYGTVLGIVLLLLRGLFLKTLPKRMVCAMWLVVFARFVVPWGLAVPLEVPDGCAVLSSVAEVSQYLMAEADASDDGSLASGSQAGVDALPQTQVGGLSVRTGQSVSVGVLTTPTGSASESLGLEDTIVPIWAVGSTTALLCFGLLYAHGRRRYKDAQKVSDRQARHWLDARNLRRRIRLVSSPNADGPLTYGIVWPTIVVPAGFNWDDWPRARFALEHEYAHIVRLDALKKMFVLVVACFYWFNPFMWMALAYFTRDLELACDEAVVRRCAPGCKKAYAHLILDIAQGHAIERRGFATNLGAGSLEERIVSIMSMDTKAGRVKLICAGLAVTALAGMFLAVPNLVAAQGTSRTSVSSQAASVQKDSSAQEASEDAERESVLNRRLSEVVNTSERKPHAYSVTATLTDTSLTIASSAWSIAVPRELVDSAVYKAKGERLFYATAGQDESVACALRLPLADGTVVEVYCAASGDVVWSDYLGEKVVVGKVGTQDDHAVMVAVYTLEDMGSSDALPADPEHLESLWSRAASWVTLPA